MKNLKGLMSLILVASMMLFLQACEQKSDSVSDAVMAPWGSTVEIGTAISDLDVLSATTTWFIEYRITVLDKNNDPMNGIGINLQTSSPYAIFQNSLSAVDLVKTDDSGTALVVVWVYGGQFFTTYPSQTDLTIQVFADIVVDSAVADISLTNSIVP